MPKEDLKLNTEIIHNDKEGTHNTASTTSQCYRLAIFYNHNQLKQLTNQHY